MDSKERFSDRVEDYVKYRPGYPSEILAAIGVQPDWVVADIGSGTGISTELFLKAGCRVYGIEPNEAMRAKAEELLGSRYPGFVSVKGSAEATGLEEESIDLVIAGQAFHWFDPVAARREFLRIGRGEPVGYGSKAYMSSVRVALIWNERLMVLPFEREYEDLILHYAGDYKTINHKNITDEQIGAFFAPSTYTLFQFENGQDFDFDGLRGRLLSSSYIPKEGARHKEMMEGLSELFARYAVDGKVTVRYDTKVYFGTIGNF